MSGHSVVVVSMPNVAPHNPLIYLRLAELGWDVDYVVRSRWRDLGRAVRQRCCAKRSFAARRSSVPRPARFDDRDSAGGRVFSEEDVEALAAAIAELRADPADGSASPAGQGGRRATPLPEGRRPGV
jgi:hypothetical protein